MAKKKIGFKDLNLWVKLPLVLGYVSIGFSLLMTILTILKVVIISIQVTP